MATSKFSEAELALKFLDYIQSPAQEVFKEVPQGHGGVTDIVTKEGSIITSYELKLQFSLSVIMQAQRNLRCSHYTYVVIPRPGPRAVQHDQTWLCKHFGIGIYVYYTKSNSFAHHTRAKFRRRICKPKLERYMKDSLVAVRGGEVTAFKETIKQIERALTRTGPIPLKELMGKTRHYHWSNHHSARACFASYVRTGVLDQFFIEDGLVWFVDSRPMWRVHKKVESLVAIQQRLMIDGHSAQSMFNKLRTGEF